MNSSYQKFHRYSSALIVYAIIVILWGAYVRISHSGDGCGNHWPLCQGTLLPEGEYANLLQTWIELFHRIKSGLFGILILIQVIWSYITFPKGHLVRRWSLIVLGLTITEALLGAVLVLGKYVDADASFARLIVMTAHLLNTLFLLGSLTVIKELSNYSSPVKRILSKNTRLWSWVTGTTIVFIAATGAWAALASTLFPSESLAAGFQADFATTSHLFVRIRIIHPLCAISLATIITIGAAKIALNNSRSVSQKNIFLGILAVQVTLGIITLLSLSPTALKLIHLGGADMVWILFVSLLCGSVLEEA